MRRIWFVSFLIVVLASACASQVPSANASMSSDIEEVVMPVQETMAPLSTPEIPTVEAQVTPYTGAKARSTVYLENGVIHLHLIIIDANTHTFMNVVWVKLRVNDQVLPYLFDNNLTGGELEMDLKGVDHLTSLTLELVGICTIDLAHDEEGAHIIPNADTKTIEVACPR